MGALCLFEASSSIEDEDGEQLEQSLSCRKQQVMQLLGGKAVDCFLLGQMIKPLLGRRRES
jgi:hypothetical protein